MRLTFNEIVFAGILWFTPHIALAQWTPDATTVLNYCKDNPNNCSISIRHVTGGWQKDYHGRRLNVLASTFKLVPLIAYGEAVSRGQLNPNAMVTDDQWAEFWTGQDGGALSAAWTRLGRPQQVTLDQMVSAMLRESDNATPDYLLDKLGASAMDDIIQRYMPGYVDTPQSIGALFTSWMGSPGAPVGGAANLNAYSGIFSFGYSHKELPGLFASLHSPQFVQAHRQFVCATPPWQTPPSTCTFGSGITEAAQRPLETGYFPQSNTRTYTNLMTGLLQRNLLPSHVQAIIEPQLEWRLSTLAQTFRRYGAKGGSLATGLGYTVLTWTAYVETQQNAPGTNHGTQAVVTIHLQDRVNGSNALQALIPGVTHFADALVEDPAFAAMVRQQLPDDPALPDLIARITQLGPDFPRAEPTKIQVMNIGAAHTGGSTALDVFISDTSQLPPGALPFYTAQVPPLGPEGDMTVTINHLPPGKFIIVVVDPQNLIVESDKQNNTQYEKLMALR